MSFFGGFSVYPEGPIKKRFLSFVVNMWMAGGRSVGALSVSQSVFSLTHGACGLFPNLSGHVI